ncbi:uncharacterized protein [Prorops nasuta]|uniref:uncharacterized protein n=1 Tax=Prorops nasuta TaxID=863751 RepID=UPI0034CDD0E6
MDPSTIINFILDIIDGEDGLLLEITRQNHFRIPNFFTNVALRYSLTDFKSHFRVNRETFEILIATIGPNLVERGSFRISVAKQIAIALWIFGNQEVYRSVADRFGLSKQTIWKCVFNVAYALLDHVQEYIKWPNQSQLINIQHGFLSASNIPGIIGSIDGCHIPISSPTEYPNSYVNRKGFHSMVLQGICDHKMRFIDVFTGFCGSVHDARVWQLSDIKRLSDNNVNRYFPENTHLIGDSAYPLSQHLLVPYRDNGHLNNTQKTFNTQLSKARIVIERAFGILKGRFRKLKYVYMYNTEMIPLIIISCCILHNICLSNEEADGDDDFDSLVYDNEANSYEFEDGIDKRDIIAHLLS